MYKCIYIFFVSVILFANLNLYSIAEDLNIEKLIERLNTIENRIKVLEKATFSKTTSDFNNNVNLDDYQSIITKQSIQISELQNEIQFLTAKVEEMIFTMQSTVNNFNTFREDTEFRFIDINNKTDSIEKNQKSVEGDFLLSEQETPTGTNQAELQPKSLGTVQVVQDENQNSPFEIKKPKDNAEQEIIGTIAQDNIVMLEQQQPVLNILPEGDELGQYEYAMNLLKQGDYITAEQAFIEFISIGKDSNLLSNSNFWLAETYYVRENYKEAAKNYLNLYQAYPETSKAPNALLKLGISLVNMGELEQGCITFSQLQDAYPDANSSIIERGNLEIEKNNCETT